MSIEEHELTPLEEEFITRQVVQERDGAANGIATVGSIVAVLMALGGVIIIFFGVSSQGQLLVGIGVSDILLALFLYYACAWASELLLSQGRAEDTQYAILTELLDQRKNH